MTLLTLYPTTFLGTRHLYSIHYLATYACSYSYSHVWSEYMHETH